MKIISVIIAALIQLTALTGLPFKFSEYSAPVDPQNGGDPFIVEDNGSTYYMYTTNRSIEIRKITSFDNTTVVEQKTVYTAGNNGITDNIWAPEIFKINGRWYIISCALFASSAVPQGAMPEVGETANHTDYYRYGFVLESKTEDIMGEYEFKGRLAPDGLNNIDGTYLQKDGKLYYVCSAYLNTGHQCIYIAEMENPYTLKTDENGKNNGAMLSRPEYKWEKHGWYVNEGPAALYKNDSTYLVYSASGYSSGYYCMGILSLTGSDPMNPQCWVKSAVPFFSERTSVNQYHTGHCSFLYRENGDIYMVYHATDNKDFSVSPRCTYIKKMNFIGDCPIVL